MTIPAIDARDLRKRYGGFVAVDGLDLRIEAGTVFGLLGPNGSGKTTTILMLMGLTEVTSGSVRVLGLDPVRQPLEVKRVVGYMPDSVGFYDDLSARENLRYTGKLAGLRGDRLDARIGTVLTRVRLTDAADRRVGTFSRGMRQRLGLADVLLKEPRVAILDEPTNGLDPESTHEFLDLIRDLKSEGLAVLLSSHLLDRVQAVCDRVGLFHRGRMVLEGTVDELARRVLGGGLRITVEARGGAPLGAAFRDVAGVNRVEQIGDGVWTLHADQDVRPAVAATVARQGGALLALAKAAPSLDDVYAQYFREVRHAA
jgi:ABC-2 type transport system ATP-binding protein